MNIFMNNKILQVLIIFVVLDTTFGFLRSVKERKTNSTIGIDGIIRKCSILFSIVCCIVFDFLIDINLISFIPKDITNSLNLGKVGIAEVFGFLYCIFELLSIFKNMHKLGIPLPIKLKNFLEKLLEEFTEEVKVEKEGNKNDK